MNVNIKNIIETYYNFESESSDLINDYGLVIYINEYYVQCGKIRSVAVAKYLASKNPSPYMQNIIFNFACEHNVKSLIEKFKDTKKTHKKWQYFAAKSGRMDLIENMDYDFVVEGICASGNLERLKQMQYINDKIFQIAYEKGFIDIINWLPKHQPENYYSFACRSGNVELLKMMKPDLSCITDYISEAICRKKLNVVKYLCELKIPYAWHPFNDACRVGNMEIIKFLVKFTKPCERHVATASREGHLKVVKFLISIGTKYNKEECLEVACLNYCVNVVKYFISLGATNYSEDCLRMHNNCIHT